MEAYRQWMLFVLVPNGAKTAKYPCNIAGHVVSAHDQTHWVDAPTARAAALLLGDNYGTAFVFTERDPFWFIDIDNCYVNGAWSPLAQRICQQFAGAAVEVSQSGTGLHLFGTGICPAHGCRNVALGLELYTSGRFVALTGTHAAGDAGSDHSMALAALVAEYLPVGAGGHTGAFELSSGPVPEWRGPTDDADLLRRALQSGGAAAVFGQRATFTQLWNCDTEALRVAFPDPSRLYDASGADAALIAHLSFWTGKDGARIDRLMRQSKLVREKWDREDYLPRSICEVLARPGGVLTDKLPEPPPGPAAVGIEAPAPVRKAGNTFLGVDDQIGHFKGCVWVHSMNRVLTPGGYLEKPDQFRVTHGGYTFMMDNQNDRTTRDAWEAFTQSQALTVARADATCFKPAILPGAIVENAGRTYVNTWWPAKVARTVGDVTPFLEHLRKILPDDRDRKIYLSYMAACVQHVGKKFAWCPVLQGAEGNGKTLFSMCVAEAVGQHYTHWIDAAGLASPFNSFLANKVFLAVEELRVAEHQEEVIRLLYGIITGGAGMQIQAKGVDQMSMEICCNLMATSNYKNAIRKTADNARRFCLLFSAQQSKADIVRDGMGGDYFPRLYDWLKLQGGFAIVSELLHTYPIEPEFDPTRGMHRAPDTTATAAAIVESMGSVEQHIAEAVAAGLPGFIGGWVSTAMVDRLLEDMHMGAKISPQRRRQMLVEMGYVLHPGLPDGRCTNPVQPDGRRPQLFIRPGSGLEAIVGAAEIGRKYSMDQLTSVGVRA